jgi:hypothetical protein
MRQAATVTISAGSEHPFKKEVDEQTKRFVSIRLSEDSLIWCGAVGYSALQRCEYERADRAVQLPR